VPPPYPTESVTTGNPPLWNVDIHIAGSVCCNAVAKIIAETTHVRSKHQHVAFGMMRPRTRRMFRRHKWTLARTMEKIRFGSGYIRIVVSVNRMPVCVVLANSTEVGE